MSGLSLACLCDISQADRVLRKAAAMLKRSVEQHNAKVGGAGLLWLAHAPAPCLLMLIACMLLVGWVCPFPVL